MKSFLTNKLLLAIIGGIVLVGIGIGVYFGTAGNNQTTDEDSTIPKTESVKSDDFQRTGQDSFGLAVCEEMTKEEVFNVIGKSILKTEDYSSSGSTGCKYFVSDTSFVIIDVGYSDMADQRVGLLALDRTIESDGRIKLDNMLVYSEKGLIDVYMDVAPGQKFVRVGRSSTTAVEEEILIDLAIATEAKIRSFK